MNTKIKQERVATKETFTYVKTSGLYDIIEP